MDTLENTKIENNKIIALFMGFVESGFERSKLYHSEKQIEINPIELWYDLDWNWLMEVIKKIADETSFELVSGFDYCYWNKFGENPFEDSENEFGGYSDIQNIYTAVIEFIKWYNKQNP